MLVPDMLNMADVMAEFGDTEEFVFDLGISGEIDFLVVVPLLGACRVPEVALSHFMAGADEYTAEGMRSHWGEAVSGKWPIKRTQLRIWEDSWNRYSCNFGKTVEAFDAVFQPQTTTPSPELKPSELCMLMDASICIAKQKGWQNSVRETFLRRMMAAANEGKLTVYDPETEVTRLPEFGANCPDEFTTPEAVNKWLLDDGGRLTWVMDSPEPQAATVVDVGETVGVNWALVKPQRFPGYAMPLYNFLKAAYLAGGVRPTARDVLEEWRKKAPPEVAKVMTASFDYYDAKGDTKEADLNAIRKSIYRMTGHVA